MSDDNRARKNTDSSESKVSCRPFLKWVGGKSQLLGELLPRIPSAFERYFEPFLGGGALFFALQPPTSILSDMNSELITTYTMVRDDVGSLVTKLRKHRYEKEHFYDVRNADRTDRFGAWSPARRAARVIFLNKSCFNGLYRVNSKGHFNVPFGRYSNPKILDESNLRACSLALQNCDLLCRSFEAVAKQASKKDFVYFDPPYVPLSVTSQFTSYGKDGFDLDMQRKLFEVCCKLDKKGVKFMLSNSSAPFVVELYEKFRVELVDANRAVNSVGSKRGKVSEVIVRNY